MNKRPDLRYSMVCLSCVSASSGSIPLKPWIPSFTGFHCRLQARTTDTEHRRGKRTLSVAEATLLFEGDELCRTMSLQPCFKWREEKEGSGSLYSTSPRVSGCLKNVNNRPKEESKLRGRPRKTLQEEAQRFNIWHFWASPGKFQPPTQHHSCLPWTLLSIPFSFLAWWGCRWPSEFPYSAVSSQPDLSISPSLRMSPFPREVVIPCVNRFPRQTRLSSLTNANKPCLTPSRGSY